MCPFGVAEGAVGVGHLPDALGETDQRRGVDGLGDVDHDVLHLGDHQACGRLVGARLDEAGGAGDRAGMLHRDLTGCKSPRGLRQVVAQVSGGADEVGGGPGRQPGVVPQPGGRRAAGLVSCDAVGVDPGQPVEGRGMQAVDAPEQRDDLVGQQARWGPVDLGLGDRVDRLGQLRQARAAVTGRGRNPAGVTQGTGWC